MLHWFHGVNLRFLTSMIGAPAIVLFWTNSHECGWWFFMAGSRPCNEKMGSLNGTWLRKYDIPNSIALSFPLHKNTFLYILFGKRVKHALFRYAPVDLPFFNRPMPCDCQGHAVGLRWSGRSVWLHATGTHRIFFSVFAMKNSWDRLMNITIFLGTKWVEPTKKENQKHSPWEASSPELWLLVNVWTSETGSVAIRIQSTRTPYCLLITLREAGIYQVVSTSSYQWRKLMASSDLDLFVFHFCQGFAMTLVIPWFFKVHTLGRFGAIAPSMCFLCFLSNLPMKRLLAYRPGGPVRCVGLKSAISGKSGFRGVERWWIFSDSDQATKPFPFISKWCNKSWPEGSISEPS